MIYGSTVGFGFNSMLPITAIVAFAIQFVVIAILFAIFVVLMIRLTRLAYRGLSGLIGYLPGSTTIKLISISVAAWLFPDLINFLVFMAFTLFQFVFIDIPKSLLPNLKSASGTCIVAD